ncbi:MAG: hypothetical protein ACI38Z_02800 [Parafannyhessea sp.]|uniref:hypothetical protein n=1 Tax=Parafannyhessea sp. TaxID=2847324 RepID=UPI003F0AC8E4
MKSIRKNAPYLLVIVSAAYVLFYFVRLTSGGGAHYSPVLDTLLDLVAMPVLLFSLGVFLAHKLNPNEDEVPDSQKAVRHARARKAVAIAIAAIYAVLVVLAVVTALPNSPLSASAFQYALMVLFCIVEYGGFLFGIVYGLFV